MVDIILSFSFFQTISLARPTRCGLASEPSGGSKPPTAGSQQPAQGPKQATAEAKHAASGAAQGAEAVRTRKAPEYIPPAPPP